MDVDAIRERFARSRSLARLLPEPLRTAAVPYFEAQKLVNRAIVHSVFPERFRDLPEAHRLLTGTTLRELPLWHLGSNAHPQRVAARLADQGVRHPWVEHQLGLRAMADREYDAAADHFHAATEFGRTGRGSWRYRLYALCLAGRAPEAARLAADATREPGEAIALAFLAKAFPDAGWPSE
jgi:hypothetical protein